MNLDPKLISTVLTAVVGWLVVRLGLDLDADAQAAVVTLLAAVAGYVTPNTGTVLRTAQEDGNAVVPEGSS